MEWSPAALKVLRSRLAPRYRSQAEREAWLLDYAGFTDDDLLAVEPHPAPVYAWFNVLRWANPRGKVDAIVAALRRESPDDVEIQSLQPSQREPAVREPDIVRWNGAQGLEKVLGEQSTLVGVGWLAAGLVLARAVGRVAIGDRGGYGTGFLLRGASGDLLVTNHHVLPSPDVAATSIVAFNYEEDAAGRLLDADEWRLDPTRFHTSATSDGDDWTAVGVSPRGDGNRATVRYGAIPLAPVETRRGDRVNIVQHPGGERKQIATVSNLVAWSDARRVQYLTDTEPGSSGSPVFDMRWRLVAVHHAGGLPTRDGGRALCNEGISVGLIHAALQAAGEI